MTDKEISMFIDAMEGIGDVWDYEDVKRVYGDKSLEDAIVDRKKSINAFLKKLAARIK